MLTTIYPTCVVRRVHRRDLPEMKSHMARLDPESRRSRYGYAISDRSLDIHAEKCFTENVILYGYFEDGLLRGIGELHLTPNDPQRRNHDGELAFSVERPYRGFGIGTRLVENLLVAARNRNVTQLSVLCRADNLAMLTLARRYATHISLNGGMVTGHLKALEPTLFSRLRNGFKEGLRRFHHNATVAVYRSWIPKWQSILH